GRVAVRRDTQTESHRVELREVAGCLSGKDPVVRGDAVFAVRGGDVDDLCAVLLHQVERCTEGWRDARPETAVGKLLDDADFQSLKHVAAGPITRGLSERRPRVGERGGVLRVMSADDIMQQTGVEHRTG